MLTPTERRRIADIIVGERHRKDLGDLQPLADSIAAEGLLQPIGVTEENELVFGERRLRACADILKWEEIDVRVVNVSSIAAGEHDENEVRKQFTVSEQVAIRRTIETKKRGGDQRHSADLPNEAKAAEMAGFSSLRVANNAERIVRDGSPELVAAMDAGKVSIDAADRLSRLPAEEQREIVAKPEPEIRAKVRELHGPSSAPRSTPATRKHRITPKTMSIPLSAKQAASAILRQWGSLGLIEDLIKELQQRVSERRAQEREQRSGA